MINIVAIFMHNDYHQAKFEARDNQQAREEKQAAKIAVEVKKIYKQQ